MDLRPFFVGVVALDKLAIAPLAVVFQSEPYRIEKLLLTKGLGQDFISAELHGLHRDANVRMAADENDGT
ncbi:hypothetical protein GCM10007857_90040 [Bradyrhizobium iriomotense]|uniref:Uncharacterized protein n=1 Tax=Bradyrhizobium iriomotense TaxID=441950 RepID=A0ABQ6BFH3_9BRAD|nr:hypothetical protein GCM10007857_90040 [Bradyrhizobium iriomotense]